MESKVCKILDILTEQTKNKEIKWFYGWGSSRGHTCENNGDKYEILTDFDKKYYVFKINDVDIFWIEYNKPQNYLNAPDLIFSFHKLLSCVENKKSIVKVDAEDIIDETLKKLMIEELAGLE